MPLQYKVQLQYLRWNLTNYHAFTFMVPDKDEAGRKAYNRLYQFFLRYGNQLTRIDLPQNIKDYSEYYNKIHSKINRMNNNTNKKY